MPELMRLMSKAATRRLLAPGPACRETLFVIEFPRSGGTWIGDQLAEIFRMPYPKRSPWPGAGRKLIHAHWDGGRLAGRTVYVIRDGRDVAVSALFYVRALWECPNSVRERRIIGQRYPALTTPEFEETDAAERLPGFLEQWFAAPLGTRSHWGDHVLTWCRHPGAEIVTYEALRRDPVGELRRVTAALGGGEAELARIAETVANFGFEAQTGRREGKADWRSAKRKGVVGDWRNHFGPEAARVFAEKANGALLELGYEDDPAWHEKV